MPITLRVESYCNEPVAQPLSARFDQLGGTIGRAVGSGLMLDDASKYISRTHARIDFQNGAYCLTDLGSNPSLVNERPLGNGRQVALSHGDLLSIGDYQIKVDISSEQAAPLPLSPLQTEAPAPARLDPAYDNGIIDSLSGASILDVGGAFDLGLDADPLGMNLFTPQAVVPDGLPMAPQRATPAFRGAESDHVSPELQAFSTHPVAPFAQPAMAPPAPPASARAPMAIPDDYDPLADFLPPRVSSAAPSAPAQAWSAAPAPVAPAQPTWDAPAAAPSQPAWDAPAAAPAAPVAPPAPMPAHAAPAFPAQPAPAFPAPPAPVSLEQLAPTFPSQAAPAFPAPPAPASPLPVPPRQAPVDAAPNANPAPHAPVADSELLQALLRGLGLPDLTVNRSGPELAELVGAMLREATGGTMGVLMARAMTKRESRLEMTMIATQANNPLKFFPDTDSALSQMLGNTMPGYMAPVRAYATAFDDLKAHELAILAGMRAALGGVLHRFDPAAIEQRLQVPTVMDKMMLSNRKAKMWDRLVELYQEIARDADDDFQRMFGEQFAAAYEEQIARLRQSRR